ncbi:TetR/AcrR family transcriptional regulator [candidate division FCPU426 bacterium]|nr:TetR/AcrR family transcriptional regulator [candidate division FCPU426 bacterium]
MTRPSRNLDQKLISAALALLPSTGYSGLSMRAVAKKANVNLGMFHYYFKNKDEFVKRVAEEFYDKLYRNFTLGAAEGETAREQLRNAIAALVKFGKENRKLLLALIKDVMSNHQPTIRLLEKFLPRHGVILLRLVRQCQREGLISNIPLPTVMMSLMAGIFGPVVVMTILEQVKLSPPYEWGKRMVLPFLISDRMIEQRMRLLFDALAPRKELESMTTEDARQINQLADRMLAGQLDRQLKTASGPRRKA